MDLFRSSSLEQFQSLLAAVQSTQICRRARSRRNCQPPLIGTRMSKQQEAAETPPEAKSSKESKANQCQSITDCLLGHTQTLFKHRVSSRVPSSKRSYALPPDRQLPEKHHMTQQSPTEPEIPTSTDSYSLLLDQF